MPGAPYRGIVPQLFEIRRVVSGQPAIVEADDHVFLPRPAVGRPVGRTGPDRGLVAHHVLVVHEVWNPRNCPALHRQRTQEVVVDEAGGRERALPGMVLVVDHANDHAAPAPPVDGAAPPRARAPRHRGLAWLMARRTLAAASPASFRS